MNFRVVVSYCTCLMLIAIAGCTNDAAFVKAKNNIEQGDVKLGLVELKKLVSQNPSNLEYKNLYYKQRELTVNKLLQLAENARSREQWKDASGYYQNVLEVDEANTRAQAGLNAVEVAVASEAELKEIAELVEANQAEVAKEKIRKILNEQPNNVKVRKLANQIDKRLQAASGHYTEVVSKFKKPINLELKDANVKTVFQLLSQAAGVNFILDKEIKADTKISVFVKHTTINDALKNIFASAQLSKKILNENSVLVYPNSKKSEYEEILVRTFYLTNVEAKKAEDLIKTVIKTKDIFIDEKLNILVMRDSVEAIRSAERLISSYDVGDPEVLLEVEVLEISNTLASELGLRFPNQLSVGVAGAAGGGQLSVDEARHLNSSMVNVSITDPTLILNLRGADGSGNLLANPHIRVKNHKKAKVHIGDRVPVITNTSTATGFVSESVSYLDVGLKLDVEPSITMDDEVSIDVGLEVSNIVSEVITKSGSLSYRLGTRNASTSLRLKNGETQILAGLINSEERTSADRVPGLSSLPIIGRLFSNKNHSNNKTEIVLLITPKIVRNAVSAEFSNVEFSLGTESGNSVGGMANRGSVSQGDSVTQLGFDAGANTETIAQPVIPIQLDIPPPPPLPGASPAVINGQ